jgi:hypothetical protein
MHVRSRTSEDSCPPLPECSLSDLSTCQMEEDSSSWLHTGGSSHAWAVDCTTQTTTCSLSSLPPASTPRLPLGRLPQLLLPQPLRPSGPQPRPLTNPITKLTPDWIPATSKTSLGLIGLLSELRPLGSGASLPESNPGSTTYVLGAWTWASHLTSISSSAENGTPQPHGVGRRAQWVRTCTVLSVWHMVSIASLSVHRVWF